MKNFLSRIRFQSWFFPVLLAFSLTFSWAGGAQGLGSQPSPVADGMRLVSADQASLTVELLTPQLRVVERQVEGQACSLLEMEGYVANAQPGWPKLPGQGALIGVPAGAQPDVRILDAQVETLVGLAPPCPASQMLVDIDLSGQVQGYRETAAWDRAAYQLDQWLPGEVAQVSLAGKLRSQEVARLYFAPLQYNPLSGELRLYHRLLVQVDFDALAAGIATAAPLDEGPFEASLAESLLNYDQARPWRVTSQKSIATEDPLGSAAMLADKYRVRLNQDGLYKVSYEELQTAGAPVDTWDPLRIQMADGQGVIPIQVFDGGDGGFDPGDYLLFYGQKLISKYTDVNVYWVYQHTGAGLRMATLDGTPNPAASIPPHFIKTVRLEENAIYQSSRPSGPDNDHWYWAGLQATSSSGTIVRDFTVELDNLSSEPLTARLRGILRSYTADPGHRTRIYLNGNLVDEADWPFNTVYSFDKEVPQSYLLEGANQVRLEVPVGDGINSQTVFLNWFEIDYHRTYNAQNERLFFAADSAGTWEFHLAGFAPTEVKVYDLTNPRAPSEVSGVALVDPGGERVFRHVSAVNPPRLLALGSSALNQVLSIAQVYNDDLRDMTNRADYLVITHASFKEQAQRLADLRSQQGLQSKVVDIQDVYDLFGVGEIDPLAIREFLAYAYQSWTPPAPSYVVLMGDGHYDFKNFLKYNQPIYVPTYLGDLDPYMGETAADNRFVTVSGSDNLPDMHLGRLPASTLAEATDMVDKIIAYVDPPVPPADWYKKTTFVTDNPDGGGDFYTLSDNIINGYLPLEYARQKIYYLQTHMSAAETKNAMIAAINEGRLLVSYVGHGSAQWWAYEKLFTKDDVPLLTNAGALTFFVPMTCLEGYYINPAANSQALAEFVIRKQAGGAIATWTPTGLGVSTGHDVLQSGLFLALFYDHVPNLGIATTQAKYHLVANAPNFQDLVDTYILLGDPATSLHTIFQVEGKHVFMPYLMRRR